MAKIKRTLKIFEKFDNYSELRDNLTIIGNKFFNCKRTNNQRFDDFVTELRQRVNKCEFGDLRDFLIEDILIVGSKDLRLTERLPREPDLTLGKAI